MIGKNIIELDNVDSTNLYLNELLKNNQIEEGTLVVATEQTTGRGQMNNAWESQPGMNLLISIVVYPDFLNAGNQFMLSKFVALGILRFLEKILKNVKIKWPNDIYVGDKKIAGVLIENCLRGTSISNSIIGIGLNVNQKVFSKSIPNPTSMSLEANCTFDLRKNLELLCEKLAKYYHVLRNGNYNELNQQYINSLYRFNEKKRYKDASGEFYANIVAVNEEGQLCLKDEENKTRIYSFKEVEFLL